MRYIIGILVTLGLIILVLIMLFHGGGSSTQSPKALTLKNYSTSDSVASLTIGGPITSQQTYQEVEIDVTNTNVTFNLYNGYQRDVAKTQTYDNNTDAYTNFLIALQRQNFTKGNTDPKLTDYRAVCSLGNRYAFGFSNDDKPLVGYWTTSCGTGTSKALTNAVITLFERQVPDYNQLTNGTVLNNNLF